MLIRSFHVTRSVLGVYVYVSSVKSADTFTAVRSIVTAKGLEMMSESSHSTNSFQVVQIPCLSDNYGYLLHNSVTGETAAVDTPDAKPYQKELAKRGWKLTHILNTHHHLDHTGGNMELKVDGVKVYGPAVESIPGRDIGLQGGDEIEFGSSVAKIIDVGGHTKGHIAYYFPSDAKVFVGDSLFALGCGRMFEGTQEQNWASLKRLRDLPDNTEVYWYVI
jgi:hydroxyacylglutathione hydrolase